MSNRNTRERCEIYLKLTIKTPEKSQWRGFDIFIINSENVSDLFSVIILANLNK